MKKTLKITAIILSVVAVLVTHPFLRVNAMEIRQRPIALERVQNISNTSTALQGSQVSYNYSVQDAQQITYPSIIADIPVIYSCDFVINFRQPVSSALITLTFTTPSTTNYAFNFITEYGRVTTFNQNTITIQAYNTDIVYMKIYFSYKQLQDNYGYPNSNNLITDVQQNPWVQNGYTYFQVLSATMASATLYEGEYTSKLNSILASVDGIEGLLQSIGSNTGYLSDIDTNIDSILSVLNGINMKLDTLDNINWITINTTYKGWTTDYQTFNTTNYGYFEPGWYVIQYPNFSSAVSSGIYKLTIPLGAVGTTFTDIKMAQYWEGAWREFTPNTYLYFPTRNYIVIYFTVSETYHAWPQSDWPLGIYVGKRMYMYSSYVFKLEHIQPTDNNYWEVLMTMKQLNQINHLNGDLSRIIYLLENMNINVTNQDVTNIVNQYDVNIDQVFNVENNINQQLQDQMQNYTPDNTNILQRLNDSSILLKSVMNQINGIEIFSIPIAVALVSIVLLAIVG